jgi:hypothetical protein
VSAVAELRAFVDSQHCDVEEYLAISGLEVASPISLSARIDLIPITAVPESVVTISVTDPDWTYFGRNAKGHVRRKTVQTVANFGTRTLHADPHIAMAALRIRHRREPKVLTTPVDLPNSLGELADTLRVLAAELCTAMFPVVHWTAPTPATPLWSSFGWRAWYHLNSLREFETTKGNEERIVARVAAWEGLTRDVKSKLVIPLDRLNRAIAAPLAVDCAIELGIALEALLLSDLGKNEQLSLAFRLRGAWLLGTTPEERCDLRQKFNQIYECRSTAVHHGALPSKGFSMNGAKISADVFIEEHARALAATAILNVISRGKFPAWEELLVGAGE